MARRARSAISDCLVLTGLLDPATRAEDCCNRTTFSKLIKDNFVDLYGFLLSNTTEEDCYRALDYNYTPWPHIHDTDANRDMLVRVCNYVMYLSYLFQYSYVSITIFNIDVHSSSICFINSNGSLLIKYYVKLLSNS